MGFNGNFASLFPFANVLQSVQTDLGLTYAGTLLANAGNTSTTVQTFTGALIGVPVSIWTKAINTLAIGAGAQFNIYYDGLGVTPSAQSPVTPAIGTPIALTGAGTGLSVAWAAGTSINNDGWKAASSALNDQTANALHYTQGAAGFQPLVALGLNGFPYLSFDNVNDTMQSSLNLPASGTTPTCVLMVLSLGAFSAQGIVVGQSNNVGNQCMLTTTGATAIWSANPSAVIGAYVAGTPYRIRADFSNNTGDIFKVGSTPVTGNAGNQAAQTGRSIGAFSGGAVPSALNLLALMHLNIIPSTAQINAFDAAVAAKYAGAVQI